MGEVYEATHVDDARSAAVKLLRRELMLDRAHVERFLREVRAASALDSPHVVRVLEASHPDDLVAFFAMERLRGETLGALAAWRRNPRAHGDRRFSSASSHVSRACASRRHRASAISKPHNVFRTEDGTWKLLDFGVAALGTAPGRLTPGPT